MRTLDNFKPQRRQHDTALGTVDKRGLKDIFQFLYAGALGRLGHVGNFRRVPEMSVIRQQDEMLELA